MVHLNDDLIILDDKEPPMSTERRQILDMLAQGKVTPEQAEKLLEKLESPALPRASEASRGGSPKFLRVQVNSSDGDNVNIRVPIALVKTGVKLTAMMPKDAAQAMSEKGIDLAQLTNLKGEELEDALRELSVDVASSDGDVVKIFCE